VRSSLLVCRFSLFASSCLSTRFGSERKAGVMGLMGLMGVMTAPVLMQVVLIPGRFHHSIRTDSGLSRSSTFGIEQ
jgi:hypothetical protein